MRLPQVVLLGLGFIAGAFGQQISVPIVSGHPFSADEVDIERPSPNVQNVPPKETIRVYRDSAGRTRTDAPAPPNQINTHFAVINDPLAGFQYSLDLENKLARRFGSAAVAMRTVPETIQPSRADVKWYTPANMANITTHSESLGTELVEGLTAEGTRVTTNHPKTSRDEEQENIRETWFSLELQMTLRIQVFNSVMGNRTISLENIDRAEPDSSLFQVPPDYTIVDPRANRPAK
jgi:hypothetical protein